MQKHELEKRKSKGKEKKVEKEKETEIEKNLPQKDLWFRQLAFRAIKMDNGVNLLKVLLNSECTLSKYTRALHIEFERLEMEEQKEHRLFLLRKEQLNTMSHYLATTISTLRELNLELTGCSKNAEIGFIQTFKELKLSRDYFFKDGYLVELTDSIRENLLADFTMRVNIEIERYALPIFKTNKELAIFYNNLMKEYNLLDVLCEELHDKKQQVWVEMEEIKTVKKSNLKKLALQCEEELGNSDYTMGEVKLFVPDAEDSDVEEVEIDLNTEECEEKEKKSFLLHAQLSLNIQDDENQDSLLHCAMRLLASQRRDKNTSDSRKKNNAHLAAEFLLDLHANLYHLENANGYTVWQEIVGSGNVAAALIVANKGLWSNEFINDVDRKGNNLLHHAIATGSYSLAVHLASHGMNLLHPNKEGHSPWLLALNLDSSQPETQALLKAMVEAILSGRQSSHPDKPASPFQIDILSLLIKQTERLDKQKNYHWLLQWLMRVKLGMVSEQEKFIEEAKIYLANARHDQDDNGLKHLLDTSIKEPKVQYSGLGKSLVEPTRKALALHGYSYGVQEFRKMKEQAEKERLEKEKVQEEKEQERGEKEIALKRATDAEARLKLYEDAEAARNRSSENSTRLGDNRYGLHNHAAPVHSDETGIPSRAEKEKESEHALRFVS